MIDPALEVVASRDGVTDPRLVALAWKLRSLPVAERSRLIGGTWVYLAMLEAIAEAGCDDLAVGDVM